MRAYYLGNGLADHFNPENLLFVKTWVRRKKDGFSDEKLIALYHPLLIEAANQSPETVYATIQTLVCSGGGVISINVLQEVFKEMSPLKFKEFFEKEIREVRLTIFVPSKG